LQEARKLFKDISRKLQLMREAGYVSDPNAINVMGIMEVSIPSIEIQRFHYSHAFNGQIKDLLRMKEPHNIANNPSGQYILDQVSGSTLLRSVTFENLLVQQYTEAV
jgi:hypothetical protein